MTLFVGSLCGVIAAVIVIPDHIAERTISPAKSEENREIANERKLVSDANGPRTAATPAPRFAELDTAGAPLAAPSPAADTDTPPAYDLPPPPPPPTPAVQPPIARGAVDSAHPFTGAAPRSIRLADSTRDFGATKQP
ncbi:MAG TPA: hypothetical protein VHV51_13745 [Polyangiaceae bacterium]|nr:hypothetical protein [Polyangiaceae bacterium]